MSDRKVDPRMKNFTAKRELMLDFMKRFDVAPTSIKVVEFIEPEEKDEQSNKRIKNV